MASRCEDMDGMVASCGAYEWMDRCLERSLREHGIDARVIELGGDLVLVELPDRDCIAHVVATDCSVVVVESHPWRRAPPRASPS